MKTDFDATIDPLPLANKLILNGGKALPEEVDFICRALLLAHVKVDQLYLAIEREPKSPKKLCDVFNAANAYVKKHGAGDSPEGLALVEAVDAAWRRDA